MKLAHTLLVLAAAASFSAQAAFYQNVVPEQSAITFSYRQMGVAMDGQFKKFQAQVQLDTAKPAQAQGSLEIDLASIDTGSGEADQEVVGKSWFHVAAHPKARFVLKGLKPTGAQRYEAQGQLTLKGQTRPITVPLELSPQGVLQGRLVLQRADYGIGEGLWSKFDVVANDITVQFQLKLK